MDSEIVAAPRKNMLCKKSVDRPYLLMLYKLFQDICFYFHQRVLYKCLIVNKYGLRKIF